MRKILVVLAVLAIAGCPGKKKDDGGGSGSAVKTVEPPKPVNCPPGNVVQDGKCVAVVTAEKVAAVEQQKTRLDDLAKLLDQVEAVSAPIELLDGFRQLPQWKALADKRKELQVVDTVVATLDGAVKKLRELKTHLGEAAQRLGNLKGELDAIMTQTGAAQQLADVRAKVSAELRAAIEPLAMSVRDTIVNAVQPLVQKLNEMGDLVIGACALAKISGGGDDMKKLCDSAKEVFEKGKKFMEDFKDRPAELFKEYSAKLEAELDQLVDEGAKKAIDLAQVAVNDALKLPPATGSAGSATGSGSATK